MKKALFKVGIFVLASIGIFSGVAFSQSAPVTVPAGSSTDVPRTISYQGLLQTGDGNPVNGIQEMTIRLYADSGGAKLVWEDVFNANVQNGVFNILLGTQKPLPDAQQLSGALWV